jgi:hypothetical protein
MQRLNREQEASFLWSLRHEAHLPGSLINSVDQLQREIGLGRRALIVTATSTFKFVLAGNIFPSLLLHAAWASLTLSCVLQLRLYHVGLCLCLCLGFALQSQV